jgi:hypothetical protein
MPSFIDSAAIRAMMDQPLPDGSFKDETARYLRETGARRNLLFLAFAPKAAGTYFRQAAMHAIGGQLIRMVHAQGGRDGTPYLPNLLVCLLDQGTLEPVTHIHMQALAANRNLIEALGIRPVIMLRSVPDMLASFMDMLDADAAARAEGLNCQVPGDFVTFDQARKTDFMIDVIAPWYASYFATWKTFAVEAPERVCVLHYDDFRADPAATLHAALTHAGFVVSRKKCSQALEKVWQERGKFRFNQGRQGRGGEYFSPAQLEKLRRMLSYYPQTAPWLGELMGGAANSLAVPQVA